MYAEFFVANNWFLWYLGGLIVLFFLVVLFGIFNDKRHSYHPLRTPDKSSPSSSSTSNDNTNSLFPQNMPMCDSPHLQDTSSDAASDAADDDFDQGYNQDRSQSGSMCR